MVFDVNLLVVPISAGAGSDPEGIFDDQSDLPGMTPESNCFTRSPHSFIIRLQALFVSHALLDKNK